MLSIEKGAFTGEDLLQRREAAGEPLQWPAGSLCQPTAIPFFIDSTPCAAQGAGAAGT
jgi:hypothetical protein